VFYVMTHVQLLRLCIVGGRRMNYDSGTLVMYSYREKLNY
jgi:hypothetical protein